MSAEACETLRVRPGGALRGALRVPGDKSISHRALLLAAIAEGTSHIRGFLAGADCLATLGVLRALGVCVSREDHDTLHVEGVGLRGLSAPAHPLDCQNSGTTMRLLAGLCAGQGFSCVLVGTEQLSRRPMRRIVAPLRTMGARIEDREGRAPLHIHPAPALEGIDYPSPVASAQVKSGVLLAGLFARGLTRIREPARSRDHTERMLRAMGVAVLEREGEGVAIAAPQTPLRPLHLEVPGDPSSAAYWIAAATLTPGSDLRLLDVGVNPTRIGFIRALQRMGADIAWENPREWQGEPVADLRVRAARLRGTDVGGNEVVSLIDELPLLAAVATQAEGRTTLRDAAELRVKESDRISATRRLLQALGARVAETPEGLDIEGPARLQGARLVSEGDHRLAMTAAVLGLVAEGTTEVVGAEVTRDSFPGFDDQLRALGGEVDRRGGPGAGRGAGQRPPDEA